MPLASLEPFDQSTTPDFDGVERLGGEPELARNQDCPDRDDDETWPGYGQHEKADRKEEQSDENAYDATRLARPLLPAAVELALES